MNAHGDDHAALSNRSVLHGIDHLACLRGARHIRHHNSQRPGVHCARHEVIGHLRDANERRERGGLQPADLIGNIRQIERAMLHVDDHEVGAGCFQQLRHAARAELQHHMAERYAAFGQSQFEAVRFHSLSFQRSPSARSFACTPGRVAAA
jgi:hypothetical protein